MINSHIKFATENSGGGISSLGLNLKSFIFQLITFLIVLLILRRWVFPKLVATLEERRQTLERSLEQARQTEQTLHDAENKAAQTLQKARAQADAALADATAQAKDIISGAEKSAEEAAARIIKDGHTQLEQERSKLRSELKEELTDLVVETTEKVIKKKLTPKEDLSLIDNAIKELQR